jgi:hypothetical protein
LRCPPAPPLRPAAIILYELLLRNRAYAEIYLAQDDIAAHVAGPTDRALRPGLPEAWPEELKQLLSDAWATEASARPEFTAIVKQLADWRADPEHTVLTQIAKGSKRGMLESLKSMLSPLFLEKALKESGGG